MSSIKYIKLKCNKHNSISCEFVRTFNLIKPLIFNIKYHALYDQIVELINIPSYKLNQTLYAYKT